MAISKQKIKQQYEAALPELLEPGERVLASTLSLTGPSPWLAGGLLGMATGQRNYYVVVTDRRVLFMKGTVSTGKPQGLAWADPRGAATVHDVDIENKVWSKFRYQPPGGKDIRFNIHRLWRDEGAAVVAAMMTHATSTQTPETAPVQPGTGTSRQ